MDLQLKGKTALVTGASMGIGRAIAKGLAAEGVRTCIAARRRALLEELAQEIITAGGPPPAIVEIDIMKDDAPRRLADEAQRALGAVGILINSAGGSKPPIAIDAPEDEWMQGMTLNFIRVRQLAHAVLPQMIAARWGRIINISGKSEPDGLLAATSAKAALHAWAKGLSREVGKHGITVNSIPPGRIMSEQIRRKYSPSSAPSSRRATSRSDATASRKNSPVWRFFSPHRSPATSPARCYRWTADCAATHFKDAETLGYNQSFAPVTVSALFEELRRCKPGFHA